MKTIIVGFDFGVNNFDSLGVVDKLQSKTFNSEDDLVGFLKKEYDIDVKANGYIFDSVQAFCDDLNSGGLSLDDIECNAFAACVIEN